MSKIRYDHRTFSDAGREVVRVAQEICQQYASEGYRLTLRQLYYRIIATDAFPDSRYFTNGKRDPGNTSGVGTKNCIQNYGWLGGLVADARVAGMIDWSHIEDRGRESSGGDAGWSSPQSALYSIESAYGISHWDGQPEHIEIWVEKDALESVIARAASPWNVGYTACKGSPSHSLVHDAALRLRREEDEGKQTTILYLGDHDPTGLDIPRDIQERLNLFRSDCKVERIALTRDQVEQYDPPPNYAKETDSRFQAYVDQYGTNCWELDALEPQVLVELVDGKIQEHLDRELYDERLRRERRERATLTAIRDNYTMLVERLEEDDLIEVAPEDRLVVPEEDDDEDDDDL